MEPFETHTHSFIVKIWRERVGDRANQTIWRGHITHVPGGERRYLKSLNDIAAFITPYLIQMGVRSSRSVRMQQWFKRHILQLTRRG